MGKLIVPAILIGPPTQITRSLQEPLVGSVSWSESLSNKSCTFNLKVLLLIIDGDIWTHNLLQGKEVS